MHGLSNDLPTKIYQVSEVPTVIHMKHYHLKPTDLDPLRKHVRDAVRPTQQTGAKPRKSLAVFASNLPAVSWNYYPQRMKNSCHS